MATHDELMKLTKAELAERILALEAGDTETITERDVRITSPAGPVHVFHGFVDDGTGAIVVKGLPEDDQGHWDPYYSLKVNDQDLGRAEIVTDGN